MLGLSPSPKQRSVRTTCVLRSANAFASELRCGSLQRSQDPLSGFGERKDWEWIRALERGSEGREEEGSGEMRREGQIPRAKILAMHGFATLYT